MRKYAYIIVLALIASTICFTSCQRIQQIIAPGMPDAEMVEPPEMPEEMNGEIGDANVLLNYLTIEGATVVNAPLPETSTTQTAPRIQADVTEINASPGGTVSLPFAYSGTNALAGCIVRIEIEGVPGYFNLPYTGAPDDLPSAISVGLPPDVELGSFEVSYSVYDDQGQYGNYLRTVINVVEPMMEMPVGPADVLIYTGATWWITIAEATIEAETTKNLLQSAGIQAEITESEETVRAWMLQTTGDGSVNVLITYGVIPNAIYPKRNTQPDGSIAENWIETSDGDAFLNQADWFGWSSSGDPTTDTLNERYLAANGANGPDALQNFLDHPDIDLFSGALTPMVVTEDGRSLTPSLIGFDSDRPIPLNQLQGEWFAEKVFASDTGDAEANYADPVIVRDGDRGRLAFVHQKIFSGDESIGEVAAEVIINSLLAE